MQISGTILRLISVSILVVVATATPAAAQDNVPRYRLIELRSGEGGATKAYALNNTGQVVGWMASGDDRHSAHWHVEVTTDLHGTVHFDLQHPYAYFDQDYSEAYDVSDADQIVGIARTDIDCPLGKILIANAFILRPAVLTDLGTPYPGDALTNLLTLNNPCIGLDSAATGVSNMNHVVGWADIDITRMHAVLITPVDGLWFRDINPPDGINDLLLDLGTLPPASADPVSSATAVNDIGQVTGYSYTITAADKAAYHAFKLWPQDTDADGLADVWYVGGGDGVNNLMTDLGTLGGTNSWGRDINNQGQVVGESDYDAGPGQHYTRAFLSDSGTMSDLGTLGGDFSAASAINDSGVIVGWAGNSDGQRRAFIYENGEMKDLNDMLCMQTSGGATIVSTLVLSEARDINEDGTICGWGSARGSDSQETRGFLLLPIDPNDCVAEEEEEEEDDSSGGGDSGTGTGTGTSTGGPGFDGTPIVGTPGNLADGTPSDADTTSSGSDTVTTTAPLLCGIGTLAFLPLMAVGLCWMKASAGRRIRRT